MKENWHTGNRVLLLENGDEFYPRVFAAMRSAQREIFVETFILNDDEVGRALRDELVAAAQRGVKVTITVDGFGSAALSEEFIAVLIAAGVNFHVFNPGRALLGVRVNLFRRMHRKITVIDAAIAYIGGINFCADQLSESGAEAKRDYAVEIEGPAVAEIRAFAEHVVTRPHLHWRRFTTQRRRKRAVGINNPLTSGQAKDIQFSASILFATRDNRSERNSIERYYHLAFRTAKKELIIANAYFFPGYHLLRRLRQAARRGTKVSLILQGHPDIPIVKWAARLLYEYLLSGGVKIYEYGERPLHGKVAIADDEWATIGSSNLDPLSLALNLEANVVIRDQQFNQQLRERLIYLIDNHCQQVSMQSTRYNWWRGMVSAAAFHVLRHFPEWANRLPTHTIHLERIHPERAVSKAN
jgi:cardiolipin synthase A/B